MKVGPKQHVNQAPIVTDVVPSAESDFTATQGVSPDGLASLAALKRVESGPNFWARLAQSIYRNSSILQEEISPRDFETPGALIEKLVELRPRIIEEQRAVGGMYANRIDDYSLAILVLALREGGRLPKNVNVQVFTRLAGFRDLFDRSAILCRRISQKDLSTPEKLIAKLLELRPLIIREQQRVMGYAYPWRYALSSLVQALHAGGLLQNNLQSFVRFAGSRDLFDRSSILRSAGTHRARFYGELIS